MLVTRVLFASLIVLWSAWPVFAIPLPSPADLELAKADAIVVGHWVHPADHTPPRLRGQLKEGFELVVTKVIAGDAPSMPVKVRFPAWLDIRPKHDFDEQRGGDRPWLLFGNEDESKLDISQDQLWFLAGTADTDKEGIWSVDHFDYVRPAVTAEYYLTLRERPHKLRELLNSREALIRRYTLQYLLAKRKGLTDAEVSKCARDDDATVRAIMATYFGTQDRFESRTVLHRYLQDPDPQVRLNAIKSVISRRDIQSIPRLVEACRLITNPFEAREVMGTLDDWQDPIPGLAACYVPFLEMDQFIGVCTSPAILARDRLQSRYRIWMPLDKAKAESLLKDWIRSPNTFAHQTEFDPGRQLKLSTTIRLDGTLLMRVRNQTAAALTIARSPFHVSIVGLKTDTDSEQETLLEKDFDEDSLVATDFRTLGPYAAHDYVVQIDQGCVPKEVTICYLKRGAEFGNTAWQGVLSAQVFPEPD